MGKSHQDGLKSRDVIYKFIEQYLVDHDYSPSMRDIGAAVGMDVSVIRYHLLRMEQDGLIERDAGIARSIRIV